MLWRGGWDLFIVFFCFLSNSYIVCGFANFWCLFVFFGHFQGVLLRGKTCCFCCLDGVGNFGVIFG